ncbi:MAG TPA: HAD-IA family hydrolase [Alphaproteobacteria bacterium]|nr:HAD-IA family hydrolase [Alphaproteobacteria bacterium]
MSANRLVVFDCDGTLVDGQHAIIAAMRDAFRTQRLAEPSGAVVRRVVGLPLFDAVARLAPDADTALVAALARAYKESFLCRREEPGHDEPLFPGVIEALDDLVGKSFLLGIATGKSRNGLTATLERHGLSKRFAVLKTSDDGPGKPSPDMLICAMSDMGAEPGSTVMIGDTVFDVEMARSARVAAIGVGWGYHESAELEAAGAAAVANGFGVVPALVERMIGRT